MKRWGAFRVQVRGKAKWSTLSPGFYFGDGYAMTREQAEDRAGALLREHVQRNPEREYRINER